MAGSNSHRIVLPSVPTDSVPRQLTDNNPHSPTSIQDINLVVKTKRPIVDAAINLWLSLLICIPCNSACVGLMDIQITIRDLPEHRVVPSLMLKI
jgi:hypothetical protein